MRITNTKIPRKAQILLSTFASRYLFADLGLIEDVYSLIYNKGSGLPTDEKVSRMIKYAAGKLGRSPILLGALIRKRVYVLRKLIQSGMFKLACSGDPFTGTGRLLMELRRVWRIVQASKCLSCNLYAQCQLGQEYGKDIDHILKLNLTTWQTLIHPNCPFVPDMSVLEQMRQAVEADAVARTEDPEVSGEFTPALSSVPTTDDSEELPQDVGQDSYAVEVPIGADTSNQPHTGMDDTTSYVDFEVPDHAWQSYQLAIPDLIFSTLEDQISQALTLPNIGTHQESAMPSEQSRPKPISNVTDLTRLAPNQHGLPEEIFEAKLIQRSLVKQQPFSGGKRPLVYILLDTSGSMGMGVQGKLIPLLKACKSYTHSKFAKLICRSICRRMIRDKGYVFFRGFSGSPSNLISARTKEEIEALMEHITSCFFNGAETNIAPALNLAMQDIAHSRKELSKAEVLLITDSEDRFEEKVLVIPPGVAFNVIALVRSKRTTDPTTDAAVILQKKANLFYSFDDHASSLDNLITVIKGTV